MIEKIEHLGLAVRDLDEALKLYRDVLGLQVDHIEEFEGMKIAFVPVGDGELELLQDTTPDGAIAKFIERKGEGLQHLAFQVKDIEAALEKVKDLGIRLIDEKPRPGAGGAQIAFLHPKSTFGVLVEFCQRD